MPCEIFPPDTGLIVADAFGAQIMCEAPEHRLHAATRKTMMLLFARAAARRLQALADPAGPYGDGNVTVRRNTGDGTPYRIAQLLPQIGNVSCFTQCTAVMQKSL